MASRFALDGTFPLHLPDVLVTPNDAVRANATVAKLHKRIARINERLAEIDGRVQDLRPHLKPLSYDERAALLTTLLRDEHRGAAEAEAALDEVNAALAEVAAALEMVPPLSAIVPPERATALLGSRGTATVTAAGAGGGEGA